MRRIERTSQFKRDYKREAKGQHRAKLDAELMPVLQTLACDHPLEARHRDHEPTVHGEPRRDVAIHRGLPRRLHLLNDERTPSSQEPRARGDDDGVPSEKRLN